MREGGAIEGDKTVTFNDGIGENPPRSYGCTLTGRWRFLQELYIWNEPSSPNFRGIW